MNKVTLAEVRQYLQGQSYICLQGSSWADMWRLIPGHNNLPKPLILGGWWMSNDEQKQERFIEHLEAANEAGVLDKVFSYFQTAPKDAWHKS